MTLSLVAYCADTGRFGLVIASSSPAVAARCAHVRAKVGAVASQNITDPDLGLLALDALAGGLSASEAVKRVTQDNPHADFRQVMAVDRRGTSFIYSGQKSLGLWSEAIGKLCAASGNLLANDTIPRAMVAAFESSTADFGDRLMAALAAGQAAGGEAGPIHSAGLKIADKLNWPYADLRIDWSDSPVSDLAQLWAIYKPQADAYVERALHPDKAPSFGVPGDR